MLHNQLVLRNKITFHVYSHFQALFVCMKYNVWMLESPCCLYSMLSESCSWSFQCLFSASSHTGYSFLNFTYNSGQSVNWMVLFWYSSTILSRLFLSPSTVLLVYHKFAFRKDFAILLLMCYEWPWNDSCCCCHLMLWLSLGREIKLCYFLKS